MNSIILTIALIATIGLVGSIILVVGSRAFAVEEDERLPELVAILPGANCGSCGYPGCEGYAKAMLDGAACNACGPGGAAVAKQLSEYLGVDAGDVAVKRAIVAENAHIAAGAVVGEDTGNIAVVGPGAKIAAGEKVAAGVQVDADLQ